MAHAHTLLVLMAAASVCRGDLSHKILGNVIDKLHAHKHKSTAPPPQALGHGPFASSGPGQGLHSSAQYQGQFASAGGSAQHQGQYVYNPVQFQAQQTSGRPQSEVPLCVCRPWTTESATEKRTRATTA